MSQPTQGDVHVNVPLSNFSLFFEQDQTAFVADKVFPAVPVEHQSNVYYSYNRGDFNRNQVQLRAAGTESAGSGYKIDSTATYYAPVVALHKDIPDQIRANADAMLNPDLEATRFLTTAMMIKKEVDWTGNFFDTTKWTSELAGTSDFVKWGDPSSSPISDVRSMKRTVQIASGGYLPNALVLSKPVYDALLDHPDIVARVQFAVKSEGSAAMVAKNVLAQFFEVDVVHVTSAIQNSAVEGAVESNAYIAGNHALLAYVPGSPSIMSAAAGLTFNWTGMFGSTAGGTRILSYYMPWLGSQRVEIEAAYAQKLVSADLGGFFYNAI